MFDNAINFQLRAAGLFSGCASAAGAYPSGSYHRARACTLRASAGSQQFRNAPRALCGVYGARGCSRVAYAVAEPWGRNMPGAVPSFATLLGSHEPRKRTLPGTSGPYSSDGRRAQTIAPADLRSSSTGRAARTQPSSHAAPGPLGRTTWVENSGNHFRAGKPGPARRPVPALKH